MKEANVIETAPLETAPAEEQQALAVRQDGGAESLAAIMAPKAAPITPAQAKVDAIANLTMQAYAKAGTLVLKPEEVAALQAEFPDEAFKPGAAGKENLIYIEHAFLRDRLNQVIGPCQWAIVPRNRWAEEFVIPARTGKPEVRGTRIYVEAMLLIRGAFVAEAVGDMDYYPSNHQQNYGDAVEGAKTGALRRCCKEIGIGLQAWKRDWCEGWWKRRTGRGDPARSQFQRATPAPQAAAQTAAKATQTPKGPPIAHGGNRIWLINKIGPTGREMAERYFRELAPNPWLLPNEGLEDLELRYVPATMPLANALFARIAEFVKSGVATKAYEPDLRADPAPDPGNRREAQGLKPPQVQTPKPAPKKRDSDWFWNIICPVPHKGERRDDYMRSPDTIASLYDSMKAGDEAARKRLWGFANNWAPEARTVNGKTYQPSEADHLFREALDAFLEWEEKHGSDTDKGQQTIQDPPTGAIPEEEEDDIPF